MIYLIEKKCHIVIVKLETHSSKISAAKAPIMRVKLQKSHHSGNLTKTLKHVINGINITTIFN